MNCLCCSKQIESSRSHSNELCKECVKGYDTVDFEREAPCISDECVAVRGFAAAVLYACLKRDFYCRCYGHKTKDPQQTAHECLHPSYMAETIRYICYLIDANKVYKLLKLTYLLMGEKDAQRGMIGVLNHTFGEIKNTYHIRAKLFSLRGLCKPTLRRAIERAIERKIIDVYYKSSRRGGCLVTRKLF